MPVPFNFQAELHGLNRSVLADYVTSSEGISPVVSKLEKDRYHILLKTISGFSQLFLQA